MSIKPDKWIRRMAEQHGMIEPFEPGQVKLRDGNKLISYGTSSYGYDVRCAREFKIFTNINSTIVDPKSFDPTSFVDIQADVCIIPPNSFGAGTHRRIFPYSAASTYGLPRQKYVRALRHHRERNAAGAPSGRGMSRWSFPIRRRCRQKSTPMKVWPQMLFFESDEECETSYKDRGGKYQGQQGVTFTANLSIGLNGGFPPCLQLSKPALHFARPHRNLQENRMTRLSTLFNRGAALLMLGSLLVLGGCHRGSVKDSAQVSQEQKQFDMTVQAYKGGPIFDRRCGALCARRR